MKLINYGNLDILSAIKEEPMIIDLVNFALEQKNYITNKKNLTRSGSELLAQIKLEGAITEDEEMMLVYGLHNELISV